MRVLLALFFVFAMVGGAQAQGTKSALFDECMRYKGDEPFCTCTLGTPYDELVAQVQVRMRSNTPFGRALEKLEKQYRIMYEAQISQAKLKPYQIEQLCEIVDEQYAFLDSLGLGYKKLDRQYKPAVGLGAFHNLSADDKVALTLSRRDLGKKLHDLDNKFQRNGAIGTNIMLERGVCTIENQIDWVKGQMVKEKSDAVDVPVRIYIRPLLMHSQKTCGGR